MVDDAVLGVGGGVVGRVGARVTICVGSGPNQADDPGDEGPAQEQVDGEDAAGAGVASHGADDGGEEIEDKADAAEAYAEDSVEKVKWIIVEH